MKAVYFFKKETALEHFGRAWQIVIDHLEEMISVTTHWKVEGGKISLWYEKWLVEVIKENKR